MHASPREGDDDWEDARSDREKIFRGDVGSLRLGMSFTSSTRASRTRLNSLGDFIQRQRDSTHRETHAQTCVRD